jgi:fructoselysine-6-P-deglycase FrlB-like protein
MPSLVSYSDRSSHFESTRLVPMTTRLLKDILRQPSELQRTIGYLIGEGSNDLQRASARVGRARNVFLTGIGASWHAAIGAGSLFHQSGRPVYLQEAAELLHFTRIPRDTVIIAISRSGRSIEIVQLLAKARESGATVVGITNVGDSPLARESDVALMTPVQLDHAVSVNTYSTLALAAAALASSAISDFQSVASALSQAIGEAGEFFDRWQKQLTASAWLKPGVPYLLQPGMKPVILPSHQFVGNTSAAEQLDAFYETYRKSLKHLFE